MNKPHCARKQADPLPINVCCELFSVRNFSSELRFGASFRDASAEKVPFSASIDNTSIHVLTPHVIAKLGVKFGRG